MKLLKGEIVQRYNNLFNSTGLEGTKLLYAVSRNKSAMKSAAMDLDHGKISPKSAAYMDYERQFNIMSSDKEHYSAKPLLALEATYAKDIAKRKADVEEYNEIMLQEHDADIPVFYIPLSLAPSTQEQFNAIEFMIAEFTPAQEKAFNELFDALLR